MATIQENTAEEVKEAVAAEDEVVLLQHDESVEVIQSHTTVLEGGATSILEGPITLPDHLSEVVDMHGYGDLSTVELGERASSRQGS